MVFKPVLETGARNDEQNESARTGFPFTLHGKKLSTCSRIHMTQNQNS